MGGGSKTLHCLRMVLGFGNTLMLNTASTVGDIFQCLDCSSMSSQIYDEAMVVSRKLLGDEHRLTLSLASKYAHRYKEGSEGVRDR